MIWSVTAMKECSHETAPFIALSGHSGTSKPLAESHDAFATIPGCSYIKTELFSMQFVALR